MRIGKAAVAPVGIVGLGHMGASLAGALVRHVGVVGYDLNPASMDSVEQRFGVTMAESLGDLVRRSQLIVLAVPTPLIEEMLDQLDSAAISLGVHPIVCDIASVKSGLMGNAGPSSSLRYVSLHPMAGREGNGAESADPTIFTDANWAVVLSGQEEPEALAGALMVPLVLGNGVLPIALAEHDRAIATVSTLPHVTAVALGRLVGQAPDRPLLRRLAAGSIRDGVRVARTDPMRIVEMFYPNRAQLAGAIDALVRELEDCRDHLADEQWLLAWTRAGHEGARSLDGVSARRFVLHVSRAKLVSELVRLGASGSMLVELNADEGGFALGLVDVQSSRDSTP
ncbi:prephenate dehydrogenase/arogenate dehydrogenase family protein [Ferrimicrobium sp.]|uniref:prephenate dehydrogenase n=1 Tax=Ferrimicrobium sp. TaxID=2926050 RepID=UPI002627E40B|nr:prephenate dehydrogenase/arogenate dehydrogenase family protein [Ferrimicrobium sp.]